MDEGFFSEYKIVLTDVTSLLGVCIRRKGPHLLFNNARC
jgi:hypothetical protein